MCCCGEGFDFYLFGSVRFIAPHALHWRFRSAGWRYDGSMDLRDAGGDPVRGQLIPLRNGLLRLHKVALDSERATYETDVERIRTSGQFLELVMHDPWFAWLHELSELIVLIDEALDAKEPPSGADASRLRKQARSLLVPDEEGSGF